MIRSQRRLGAALAGYLAMAGMAAAQPHGDMGGGPMGHEWGHDGMELLHSANLTAAQKAQVKTIMQASWRTMRPLMQQMRTLHEQEITTFLGSGSVSADQFQPVIAQEETLRNQIDAAHLDAMLKIRGVLTADQISAAATKHAQMEQLHAQERALMGPGIDEPPAP